MDTNTHTHTHTHEATTDLQFEDGFVQRLSGRLGIGVLENKLERAQDGVEEAVDDDLVHVVDVRIPHIALRVRVQQLEILLT